MARRSWAACGFGDGTLGSGFRCLPEELSGGEPVVGCLRDLGMDSERIRCAYGSAGVIGATIAASVVLEIVMQSFHSSLADGYECAQRQSGGH